MLPRRDALDRWRRTVALCWLAAVGVTVGVTAQDEPPPPSEAPGARDARRRTRVAGNEKVADTIRKFKPRGATVDGSAPTAAPAARAAFELPAGLEVELVASEPLVRQPVFLDFDHRGRLWVVEYLQYPFPAGLKVVDYDEHLRARFDRVPRPPPDHVRGADRIKVLEDRDGDGLFESAKVVIDGLNIATSVALGRGGIWVLNPPYLLFYPDLDGDDVPDGDPQVHLEGFGLEDTHAVANSLRWGPDGWLYGAQGSTCTATVKGIRFLGQAIWRYRTETREFEIFAEGGGNTFCVEFDAKGRLYSGHNGGRTRGFHYVQGGCYLKNWGKHGPLRNPYAFGFYPHMAHRGHEARFSHSILVYEGGELPGYEGQIIASIPLHNRVQASRLLREGSTFRTEDTDVLLLTKDRWFRPVDTKLGPDGGVYVCDWYDTRLTHVDPRDNWDRSNGRIYRIRRRGATRPAPFDLSKLSSREIVDVLSHRNRWFRREALRILGDRRDRSIIPLLARLVEGERGQLALEALWALNLSGGFTEDFALRQLGHADPHVRVWTVRLLGDRRRVSPAIARRLEELARAEPDPEVRSQLASSARRLPGADALPVIARLAARDEDASDPHIPLLIWWALESKAGSHRADVFGLLEAPAFWKRTIVREHLVERLMKRYVLAGGDADLASAERLLRLAPGDDVRRGLLRAFEAAAGSRAADLPESLVEALAGTLDLLPPKLRLLVDIRRGGEAAVERALALVADDGAEEAARLERVRIFGAIGEARCVPVLLDVLARSRSRKLREAILESLAVFSEARIGEAALRLAGKDVRVRSAALRLLASREPWAHALARAAAAGEVSPASVPATVVQQLRLFESETLSELVTRAWGVDRRETPEEKARRIEEIARALAGGEGDAARGQAHYTKLCGTCHKLFGEGGDIGPELTGYERDNLDFLLFAVVDPSAAVRGEYLSYTAATTDGRVSTGLLVGQDAKTVSLKDSEGRTTTLPRERILSLQALRTSLMPEKLLDELGPQELRDLFAYLTREKAGSGSAGGGKR